MDEFGPADFWPLVTAYKSRNDLEQEVAICQAPITLPC